MINMKSYMTNLMFNGKTMLRIGVLLCGIFFLSFQDGRASHIVGGNISYRCLGPNQFGINSYEIRMTMRRDCFLGALDAPFDNPASIGFFDAVTNLPVSFVGFNGELRINRNNIDTLNEILISDCSVIAGDVCVEVTVYVDTISLPFLANGYILAYQRCCRNASLTNLINPDETGMTLTAEISALAQQTCNDSPVFNGFPPIYICAERDLVLMGGASDPEGDSLKYSLCIPFAGGDKTNNKPQPPPPPPYPHVVYRPPYTIENLLGGVSLKIDTAAGTMTLRATTVGQYIVGICVTAYDRTTKQMTGMIRRDFQFNVRACREVAQADFSAQSLTCNSLTVNFQNQSQFSDIYKWVFNADDWDNSATSTELNPVHTYTEPGFYRVALVSQDQFGFCHDTAYQTVGVFNDTIAADFTFDVSKCTQDGIQINVQDSSSGFGNNYPACDWQWLMTVPTGGGIIVFPDTVINPIFNFDLDDTDPVTVGIAYQVTSCNGCTATSFQTFPVQELAINFNPAADSICYGETVSLLQNCDTELTYTWEGSGVCDNCGPDGCAVAYPGFSSDYYVTVTDALGLCSVTDSTHIGVQQLPTLDFDYTTDCKTLEVQFQNGSSGGTHYFWDFGDTPPTDTSSAVNPTYVYSAPGNYTVTLNSADGCTVDTSFVITSNALTDTLGNTTVSCFKDSVELNPVNNGLYTYVWSPAQFLNDPNSANPTAGVETNTTFYVTISQAGLEGCEIVDSILVQSPDDFFIEAPVDSTTCRFDSVTLLANTNVDPGTLDLVWTDSSGVVVGNGLELSVIPINTITYTITATNELGCSASDQVTIFKPAPDFTVSTNNDTSFCNIQSINLSATANVSPISFIWLNSSLDTIGEGAVIQVTPGQVSSYVVIGTDSLGCQASEIVTLTPTFFDISATEAQIICLGEEATLCVTDDNNQNLSYTWIPAGCDGTIHDACITVCPEDTTSYSVIVMNDDLGCLDTLNIQVTVALFDPLNVAIAGPDSILLNNEGQLFVNQPEHYTYVWSSTPGNELIDPVWNPIVMPKDTGDVTYTVTVTNEDGCTSTASITIRVYNPACDKTDIFLPNAFTPNNDGHNDELFVRGEFIIGIDFHIYSRWGEEVWFTNDKNQGWDGTFGGKDLPPDVFGYYFTATCPNQATYTEKGNVTLLK
jgi:gliding motility-associated-like protein